MVGLSAELRKVDFCISQIKIPLPRPIFSFLPTEVISRVDLNGFNNPVGTETQVKQIPRSL